MLSVPVESADRIPMVLREGLTSPTLVNFTPLPANDAELSAALDLIVREVGLDVMTPASENPDEEDEWSSICLVDLTASGGPMVAGWKDENFVYPASTYKMYVMGELMRQVVEGEKSLDDVYTVKENNQRDGDRLKAGRQASLGEILRLMMQWSDNTAANEAIDAADRQRVSMLMQALGCKGSEVTRKYLPRTREDAGYENIVSTVTSARHLATFLWATDSGAIGGGKGRGLIKSYLALNDKGRFYKGLPASATIMSKTGWWNIFTSEAALIEDGETRYILCILTARLAEEADPKIAALGSKVHSMMKARVAMKAEQK